MTEPISMEEEDDDKAPEHQLCGELVSAASVAGEAAAVCKGRKEKRKLMKKEKRKQKRKELAEEARQDEEAKLNDPEELRRIQLEEEKEKERMERDRREFEERERLFLEALARKKAQEEEEEKEKRRRAEDEEGKAKQRQVALENEIDGDDEWEYVEDGPPEIIWQGNEIIVKRNKRKVKKKDANPGVLKEDPNRPTSNPLPPQSEVFDDYKNAASLSAQQLLENVALQTPNFGTEQDKAHCPFHLKTGACRFGSRCSRVHFYPDKSCTLLMKNMYAGPGLAWEQDEGLEYTDEEVERSYEEFYEDVHTEFLKFGEIINFKVCKNSSSHLRGNVYVHYKDTDSAVLAYQSNNGRYFAGKQIACEFVSVTRWKVAICGEFMKSKLKSCSRGTTCNFIHCFRNPDGDYEWADLDKPPPRYWLKKMAALFGYTDESLYDRLLEQKNSDRLFYSFKTPLAESGRHHSVMSGSRERSRSRENRSSRERSRQESHDRGDRRHHRIRDKKQYEEETNQHDKNRYHSSDSDYLSDREREEVMHRHCIRRRSRHRHDEKMERQHCNDDNKRGDGASDSSDDFLEKSRYREVEFGDKRRGSTHEKKDYSADSSGEKRRSRSRHNNSVVPSLDDRYKRRGSHDGISTRVMDRRKPSSDKNTTDSDTDYQYNEDIKERGRWEPDNASAALHSKNDKFEIDDSEADYSWNTATVSSRSSNQKKRQKWDGMDSGKKLLRSKENDRRHNKQRKLSS